MKDVEQVTKIAKDEPQAALSAYTQSLSIHWSFLQRTIQNAGEYFQPIEDVLREKLIPAIVGRKKVEKLEELEKVATKLKTVKALLSTEQQRILECFSEKGSSNWLTALPLKKYNFHLNKQEFRDAVYLRYSISLPKLPSTCVCGQSSYII